MVGPSAVLEEVAPVTGEVVLLLMKEVLPVPVKNLEVFGGGKVPNAVVASKRGAALTPAARNEIATHVSSSAVLLIGALVVAAVRLPRPLVGDGVGADATAAAASSSAASAGGIGRGLLMGSGWLAMP